MKRIISIILALSMILSLLGGVPFTFAGAADGIDGVIYKLIADGKSHTISANKNLWDEASDYSKNNTNFAYLDASPDIETIKDGNDVTDSSGKVIAKKSDLSARLLRHQSTYFRFMTKSGDSALPAGQWFALRLKTDAVKGLECAARIEVIDGNKISYTAYLAPYETGKDDGAYYMTDGNKVSTQKLPDGASTWELGKREITADEYVIVIEQHTSGQLHIDSIVFEKVLPIPTSMQVSFEDQAEAIYPRHSVRAVVKAFYNENDYPLDRISVEWASSETSVAEIDENGRIFAKKAGETEISAKITVSGTEVSGSATLTVLERPEGTAEDTLIYGIKTLSFYRDKMYHYSNEEKPAAGWQEITDGMRGSTLIMNFILAHWQAKVNKNNAGEIVEPFFIMDLDVTQPWGVEVPDHDGLDNYQVNKEFSRVNFIPETYGEKSNKRSFWAIRMRVPYAGKYNLDIFSTQNEYHAALSDVWFGPADKAQYKAAEIDDLISSNDFKMVGTYRPNRGTSSSTALNSANTVTEQIGWVNIEEAGEYLIIFNPTEENFEKASAVSSEIQTVAVSEIRLRPIDEIKTVTAIGQTEIPVNTYAYAAPSAYNAAGEEVDIEKAVVSYSVSDDKLADINPETGELFAKAAGTLEVIADIEVYGEEYQGRTTVTITADKEATEIPDELVFSFPLGYIGVGESDYVRVTDKSGSYPGSGIEYSYEILKNEDKTDVLSEKNGLFTGLEVGRADVVATAKLGDDEKQFNFSVVVKGENLFIRHGVNHGEFERGVYLSDGSLTVNSKKIAAADALWKATRNKTRDIYAFSLMQDVVSEITGRKTNVIKATVDNTPASEGGALRVFRFESANSYYDENGTKHNGAVNLENGKIYEYTGFLKLSDVKTIPDVKAQLFLYAKTESADGKITLTSRGDDRTYYPWTEITGDMPWTGFNSGAILINWDTPTAVSPKVQVMKSNVENYSISAAHFALREVSFDRVDFAMEGSFEGAKTYKTFKTSVTPYASTGNVIQSGDAKKTFDVVYSSSNDVVAKVDEKGVITAISNGECEIYADMTIGNTTRHAVIPVSLSGLEVMFETVEAASSKPVLSPGETAETEITYLNTDKTEYSGEGITLYYESNTPELATIDQTGKITAKNPGTARFTVYAKNGSYNTSGSFEVKISDETKLVSASVTGPKNVEAGFGAKLIAAAMHESGSVADLSQCEVTFELCDEESAEILKILPDDETVEGISEGEAKIRVTVSCNGSSVTSDEFVITVTPSAPPKSKTFNFIAPPVNSSVLKATVEQYGWQANQAETCEVRVNEALSGDHKLIRVLAEHIQFKASGAGRTRDSSLAIDFMVDYDGWYEPVLIGKRTSGSSDSYIFINGEYAGEFDFNSPGSAVDIPATVRLNPIYLKRGLNTLKLSAKTKDKYLYPVNFTINWLGNAPIAGETEIVLEKEVIPVGTSCDFGIITYLNDEMSNRYGLDFDSEMSEDRLYTLSFEGDGEVEIAENTLTAKKAGYVTINAEVHYDGEVFTVSREIEITPEGFTSVEVSADSQVLEPNGAGRQLAVSALNHLGEAMQLDGGEIITFRSSDDAVVSVDENGYVVPEGEGTATVYVTVSFAGKEHTGSIMFSVREGKTKSTYYTEDKVSAARENISKYKWAKETKEAAVEEADKYLPYIDMMYEMLPSQGVPRGYNVGYGTDPDIRICRYCGENLKAYDKYPWRADALNRPWKVQCPDCKRLFPSNDFGAFYENGKNEHGEFIRQHALEENGILCGRGERDEDGNYVVYEQYKDNPYGYGDPRGNLYNELYKELYETQMDPRLGVEITQGWGDFKTGGDSGVPNAGYFWGVDDGEGYETGRMYKVSGKDIPEVHTYISTFTHIALWNAPASKLSTAVIYEAITNCRDAYLYTGDKKYAIAGAKLVDRIADFYPDYNINAYYDADLGVEKYANSGGAYGKILGAIWESRSFASAFALAYDAFFDVYDDPELISYLTDKAVKYNYTDKLVETDGKLGVTGETLRRNVEKNILEEILVAIKETAIAGNFGFKQNTLAKAAVVLDTYPKTQEMIDFIMQPGTTSNGKCTGGNVFPQIMNVVCRDGIGNESGESYNRIWVSNLLGMSETLSDYEDIDFENDLLANPKYIKMLQMELVYLAAGIRTLNIGDQGTPGGIGFSPTKNLYLAGLRSIDKWDASDEFKEEKRILFSQILYLANGNTTKDLNYGIFVENPESLQDEIDAVIDEYGEFDGVKSTLYTGYGLATLQDGVDFRETASTSELDITTRDFWMYFGGGATAHHHNDGLNLGLDAFGMNMSPDLGYPDDTGSSGGTLRSQWTSGTVSHNTVVVNDEIQTKAKYTGDVMHFTDDGEIKIMDVDFPAVYAKYVDTYRRTVVSVDVDDTVSYGIDFFRITGGDEHVYSFHAQGNETEIIGLDMVPQPMGTYAGANVPYGDATYSASHNSGYNYLENVERATNPGTGIFTADFDIKKFRKITFQERDWHLRLTMLNDFNLSEVALTEGRTSQTPGAPRYDYLLARRSGKDMDTLFTTVLEPYIGQSNIKSLERVKVSRADGKAMREDEPVAAVKVTLNNGRVDYVVYAANNEVTYIVDDLFEFCGFVGVYTVTEDDADNYVRSYLHDGTRIGETTSEAAIVGKVKDFTRDLKFENFVELELETVPSEFDADALAGKLLDIENDGFRNGDYRIKGAELDGNLLRLDIGDVTTTRGYVDAFDTSKGYEGNIQVGQNAKIALTAYDTSAPDIEPVEDKTVSAGSSITIPINAASAYGREVTLVGTTLPRGMSINTQTNTLTWKPDASQVGENHVAITADDGVLTSTVRFTVTVYGSTTSKPSAPEKEPTVDTPAGGGGGGGGGGAAPDNGNSSDQTDAGNGGSDVPQDEDSSQSDNTENAPDASGETDDIRFTDLGNHAWAADAINTLADDGIIKGTTSSTFSPAANITRADFAILLVRAFDLKSDNTENFADVSASDYFAPELAIARNTGIVNGIGDNKFAPRNTITRQDMMVIVYRALEKLGVKLESADVGYEDFADVADYAQDAVKALITSALVNGKSGRIAPTDYTTRAEVAVLIKRIIDYAKK